MGPRHPSVLVLPSRKLPRCATAIPTTSTETATRLSATTDTDRGEGDQPNHTSKERREDIRENSSVSAIGTFVVVGSIQNLVAHESGSRATVVMWRWVLFLLVYLGVSGARGAYGSRGARGASPRFCPRLYLLSSMRRLLRRFPE